MTTNIRKNKEQASSVSAIDVFSLFIGRSKPIMSFMKVRQFYC